MSTMALHSFLGSALTELKHNDSKSGRPQEVAVTSESLRNSATFPKILLVDDDPLFGKIMSRAAAQIGAPLVFCKSLDEFGKLGSEDFDIVLMDHDLGAVTGIELTEYMESKAKREVPVILVSQSKVKPSKLWPPSMREFINKSLGPFAILDAACKVYEGFYHNKSKKFVRKFH